jgi:hypothetical protein
LPNASDVESNVDAPQSSVVVAAADAPPSSAAGSKLVGL